MRLQSFRCFHNSINLAKGSFPFYNKHKKVTDPFRQDPDYFEKAAEKLTLSRFF